MNYLFTQEAEQTNKIPITIQKKGVKKWKLQEIFLEREKRT